VIGAKRASLQSQILRGAQNDMEKFTGSQDDNGGSARDDNGGSARDDNVERAQSEPAAGSATPRPDAPDPTLVAAQIWAALKEVEDPEIPISLVDMGLIVAVDYDHAFRTARLKMTYTAMGCPAMGMIQDDIRDRLLREREIEAVEIEVVWDPAWSRQRLSKAARATMRELGIAV
jgi:metal-sulfur cluster biosynthetic enzyme